MWKVIATEQHLDLATAVLKVEEGGLAHAPIADDPTGDGHIFTAHALVGIGFRYIKQRERFYGSVATIVAVRIGVDTPVSEVLQLLTTYAKQIVFILNAIRLLFAIWIFRSGCHDILVTVSLTTPAGVSTSTSSPTL